MKQKVITPDCPRCHGELWFVPCPQSDFDCGGDHFECLACKVVWFYRPTDRKWLRFDPTGNIILEMIPPRVPRFRRPR